MAKSHIRGSYANGTTKQKVAKLLRLGWEPGLSIGKILSRTNKRQIRFEGGGGRHAQ